MDDLRAVLMARSPAANDDLPPDWRVRRDRALQAMDATCASCWKACQNAGRIKTPLMLSGSEARMG
jgi:hypothetical protein